ncbi:CaiB/BaiF CoA transferase family protein [Paraburkholderia sp. MM6662-R1]|uniref:CaiB/BaiF CoA transferase family protein n=1 Tax=Paraburkholderia sp. MM6662-R1 TaxID=2991066 RepID=UPI003D1D39F9
MSSSLNNSRADVRGPLAGIKVIEVGMLFAGPMASAYLADMGADVIKLEPPKGDEVRRMGRFKDGEPLWWRVTNRGKRLLAADIRTPGGAEIVRRLAATADVFIENFRPGKLASWGLDYETLSATNRGLVMLHISGFGQTGPYSTRPGMGTLAEGFSGFAHTTGEPDGPPTLPAYPLADGVAAMCGAMSILAAIVNRGKNGGIGDEIEISLYEPLLSLLGAMAIDYDQLGVIGMRRGNRSTWSTPRNTYETSDHRWIAVSAAANSGARRLFNAIGRSDLADRSDLQTNPQRMQKLEECDGAVADWVRQHTQAEGLDVFEKAGVVAGPVYDIEQLFADKHVAARGTLVELADPVLGKVRMQGVVPRFRRAPGEVRWPGRPVIGQDTCEILRGLNYTEDEVEDLTHQGAISL